MSPLKSQILGLMLAFTTALGCIFYEKIVEHFSFFSFMLVLLCEVIVFAVIGYFLFPTNVVSDYNKFISEPKYLGWVLMYIITGTTTILWYMITKNQGVMTGSVYEIKYIGMLAIIYILFGENKFTFNTGIGIVLAVLSIYFISKN